MTYTFSASPILGNDVLGCEFFIGMTPENDSIATAIAEVAHDGGGQNIPNIGDSITLAYPLWNDTEIKTFLFSDGNDIIPPMKLENKEIKFIQLVPLYDSELEFKKQHGADGLWDKFISMKTPYWDSERQPQSGVL